MVKRSFDIIFSLLLLIILSPIFIVLIIIIRISDKDSAIFMHKRVGKDGKNFTLYKFRTMKKDSNPYDNSPKYSQDIRLIKYGRYLREYSLDELPQFFNVLKGDMSIVGPRPLYPSQIKDISVYHLKRLMVKPGITGESQVNMRSGLLTQRSLNLEVEYVNKHNLLVDLKIIYRTFFVVISKKGVY